jgi:hypothetical protein
MKWTKKSGQKGRFRSGNEFAIRLFRRCGAGVVPAALFMLFAAFVVVMLFAFGGGSSAGGSAAACRRLSNSQASAQNQHTDKSE